ncbi:MAG TPA: hypothetical protein VG432_10220 [Gemmatimonadaceae bacterium]|nr:hypothetical protein [Gemmatimonadaceae bacterium]
MRAVRFALPVAAVVFPVVLGAQPMSRAGIDVGKRVRVTTPGVPGRDRYAGRVVAVGSDSLTLHRDGAPGPRAIPFTSITKVEVSRGRRPNGWRGAGLGLVGGAAAGTVVGLITYKKQRGDCYFLAPCTPDYRPREGVSPGGGAVLGATGGLIVGAIAGRFIRTEKWAKR